MENYEDFSVSYNERILEILVFVLSEIKQNISIEELNVAELIQRGYSEVEISAAISWLLDKVDMEGALMMFPKMQSVSTSFRILNQVEKSLFTSATWGKIVEYQELGILTPEQVEFLIFRAVAIQSDVTTIEEVNDLVSKLLFYSNSMIPSGSKILLDGNDRVN